MKKIYEKPQGEWVKFDLWEALNNDENSFDLSTPGWNEGVEEDWNVYGL